MKKIGILYICTGAYVAFWEDFYKTFEEHFLKDYEKHYFVFTDADSVYGEEDNKNIHRKYLETLPWPLVTLFRFKTFLSAEDELKQMDYLMFSNSNMVCDTDITADEFLPREECGERLFVTRHPGYYGKNGIYAPFDRNKKSSAYVPYNKGETYVIGAMNGGTSEAFLEMSHALNNAIDEDLKKNVIARWHDESQLNHYIINRTDVRVLGPEYCYPFGMNVSYEKRISAVSKQAKFDVRKFKGFYDEDKNSFSSRLKDMMFGIGSKVVPVLCLMRDCITFKKVR